MRHIPLLALALALAGCGSTAEPTDVPPSASRESEPAETSGPTPAVNESQLKPPSILLVSDVGRQRAVQGSYCVGYIDEATGRGQGICSDAAQSFPDSVTAVARGDRLTFVVSDAIVEGDGIVTVRPLGCIDQETAELRFEPGTGERQWRVDLDPGAYQLDVFARFEARDGRTGDVSGVLGLTVAGPKENDALGILAVKRSMQVCPLAG